MAMTSVAGDVRPAKTIYVESPPLPVRAVVWDSALAHCRSTQGKVESAKAIGDVLLEDAQSKHARAIDNLIITPAPDQSALLVKIEFMASAYAEFAIEAMMLQALVADGRRLLVEG